MKLDVYAPPDSNRQHGVENYVPDLTWRKIKVSMVELKV